MATSRVPSCCPDRHARRHDRSDGIITVPCEWHASVILRKCGMTASLSCRKLPRVRTAGAVRRRGLDHDHRRTAARPFPVVAEMARSPACPHDSCWPYGLRRRYGSSASCGAVAGARRALENVLTCLASIDGRSAFRPALRDEGFEGITNCRVHGRRLVDVQRFLPDTGRALRSRFSAGLEPRTMVLRRRDHAGGRRRSRRWRWCARCRRNARPARPLRSRQAPGVSWR